MNEPPKIIAEIPRILTAFIKEEKSPAMSLLAALLDAQMIFRKPGIAVKDLEPLRAVFFPEEDPEQTILRLLTLGLIRSGENGVFAVPEEIKLPLARKMEKILEAKEIRLPSKTLRLGGLLDDFEVYGREECGIDPGPGTEAFALWGGKEIKLSGRSHLVLIRSCPLLVRPCADPFILLLSRIPEPGGRALADLFCAEPALRQRLAFLDLEGAQKINLTRSGVFVFFERFLLRAHGLRLSPPGALTQSLVDNGLLSFDKG